MPQPTRLAIALAVTTAFVLPATAHAQDAAEQSAPILVITPQPTQAVVYTPPPGAYPQAPPNGVYVDAYGRPVPYGYALAETREPRISRVGTLIGVTVGDTFFEGSAFNNTAALWGYSGFQNGLSVALNASGSIGRFVMLGGRLGYMQSSGGASYADSASMQLSAVDLGMTAQVGVPIRMARLGVFFPGLLVEAGAAELTLGLRNEAQNTLTPRAAAQASILFSSQHFGATLRAGYQWMRWSNAGGNGVDLSLSGLSLAVGVEVRL